MAYPWRPASGAVAVMLLIVSCLAVASVGAQAPASSTKSSGATWSVPRTVDGQPNLQGVWANNSITPLERPEVFKGRTTMTDAELEQLKRLFV